MLINDLYTNKTPAVAEQSLNEFAPGQGGGDSGNYFQALASAWYNGTFDSGSLQKGIKSQEDVERLLQRGIVCPDGVTRKFDIGYNSDFDGVVISSDDYYEHSDYDDKGQEVDSRTGQKWGPYDHMEFGGEELDESAKWRDPKYKDQLYTQEKPDYNDTREYDRARWDPKPKGYKGRKEPMAGGEFPRTDPLVKGFGRYGVGEPVSKGPRKGLPSRDQITSLKGSIKDAHGRHTRANLPEGVEGKVVFSGTSANGGKYEIIQSSPTDFMIHANGKHIDTYGSLQRAMSVLKNEVPGLQQGVAEDIGDLGYNVVRYYEKTQEVKKLTNWLEKEAGLPRNSPLYFDDVDLVYGNKTIVPGALINPKLTFNDLLTAVVQASKQGMAEATGDEKFDTMMGRIQQEPKYPDSQMPPTDVKDLYQWAVKNNKPYHKIFAEWANREGFKSVAPALQRAGNLDSDALDYWTPRVWEIYWGEVRGIDSEMPPEWAKKRIPDELRDYLETVFDAYDRIVFDWPTEYRQIGQQGVAEGSELKQAKRKYNQAAKDANADQVGAGKKIDTMKNSLRQRDINKPVAEGSGPVTHRIGLTVTDPNHPMVSKRKEPYQKSVRVTQNVPDREAAINQAIAHHRRKGYKVHDHHYIGTVDDEPIAEVSLGDYRKKAAVSQAGAKINKFFDRDNPAKVAAADQTIAKRERGLARADARTKPYTPPQQDAEKQQRDLTTKYPNIDDLVAAAERNRDPYYDRAEGNAYYAGREAEQNYQKLKQIQRVIQGLNESLDRSHLP